MTGKTASQVGIHDWLQEAIPEVGERDWLGTTRTLFQYLSEAGYHTGLSGKWHLGQSHLAPRGADYCFGLPGWQGAHNGPYTYARDGELVELDGNKSSLITDHAIEFLDTVPADKPFFLNIGYIATHSPYGATGRMIRGRPSVIKTALFARYRRGSRTPGSRTKAVRTN